MRTLNYNVKACSWTLELDKQQFRNKNENSLVLSVKTFSFIYFCSTRGLGYF